MFLLALETTDDLFAGLGDFVGSLLEGWAVDTGEGMVDFDEALLGEGGVGGWGGGGGRLAAHGGGGVG